jgi:succinyl-diaminopimelate desuccinylase
MCSRSCRELRESRGSNAHLNSAFFRRAGIPAAVWGRFCGCAHQPDEYCTIANMVSDARIYCHIFGQEL